MTADCFMSFWSESQLLTFSDSMFQTLPKGGKLGESFQEFFLFFMFSITARLWPWKQSAAVCRTDSGLFIYHGRGLAEGHVMWLNVLKTSVKLVMRLWSEMYRLCHSRLMSVFERPIYSQIFLCVCVNLLFCYFSLPFGKNPPEVSVLSWHEKDYTGKDYSFKSVCPRWWLSPLNGEFLDLDSSFCFSSLSKFIFICSPLQRCQKGCLLQSPWSSPALPLNPSTSLPQPLTRPSSACLTLQ